MIAVALAFFATGTAHAESSSYTVRSGDSLWLIATRHAVSVAELVEANGLTLDSTIHSGDMLAIPGRPSSGLTAGGSTSNATITVRRGDSLWSIASSAGVPLAALLTANDLTLDSTIYPGRSVRLPATSAPASASASSQASVDRAAGSTTYTVLPGDGLTTIARRTGVGVTTLLSANALTMTSVIHPGQRLVVPPAPKGGSASGPLVPVFTRAAKEAGIPADFLMAVAYVESRWEQSARSPSGAIGIGQLMPRTASWVAWDLMGEPALDITQTTDNIRVSARLLAWLLGEASGDQDRALAMYLQGVQGVRSNGISAASVRYAQRIAGVRTRYS